MSGDNMKWLLKIFGKKKEESKKMAKKYDIIVHDMDLDGGMHVHRENGVMADNPQSLVNLYKMADQKIEIVREYEDDESRNYGKPKKNVDISQVQLCGDSRVGGAGTFIPMDNMPQMQQSTQVSPQPGQVQSTQSQMAQEIQPPQSQPRYVQKAEPPKFFEVGGVKCKMENGKMYQKQWIRLSDTEASEFRIISDKNNKICPIKDKHIEMMKWVLIDNNDQDSSNQENGLELIKG